MVPFSFGLSLLAKLHPSINTPFASFLKEAAANIKTSVGDRVFSELMELKVAVLEMWFCLPLVKAAPILSENNYEF